MRDIISQTWIKGNNSFLFATTHWSSTKPRIGVLLFAGFSQPLCDIDYFMSKLARRLSTQDIIVVQVDLSGHGDSSGNMENINLNTIRDDINTSIKYVYNLIQRKVVCLGRGLSATVLSEFGEEPYVLNIGGINPYCIDINTASNLWSDININLEYELLDLCSEPDSLSSSNGDRNRNLFFEALGAEIKNLHGQKISGSFIFELMNYNAQELLGLCKNKNLWLVSNEQNEVVKWEPSYEAFSLNHYKRAFIRDPLWQHQVMESISSWITTES